MEWAAIARWPGEAPPRCDEIVIFPCSSWNNTDVLASYMAGDSLSGLDSPASGSFTFSAEAGGKSHTFTLVDKAGNSDSATISSVNIDKTPPTASAPPSPGPKPMVEGASGHAPLLQRQFLFGAALTTISVSMSTGAPFCR